MLVLAGNSWCDPADISYDGELNAFDTEPFLAILFEDATSCRVFCDSVSGDG